jgi:hypothetical protein
MIRQEHPQLPKTKDDPPIQLWAYDGEGKDGKPRYYHVGLRTTSAEPPNLKRGGLLSDAMG